MPTGGAPEYDKVFAPQRLVVAVITFEPGAEGIGFIVTGTDVAVLQHPDEVFCAVI
jgi:hypothetical protein